MTAPATPVPFRISVQQGEEQGFIVGELREVPGESISNVWSAVQKEPFKDYFLFVAESPEDRSRRFLVFSTDSHRFSKTGHPVTATLPGIEGARLTNYRDHPSSYRVVDLTVQLASGSSSPSGSESALPEVVRRLLTPAVTQGMHNSESLQAILQEGLILVGGRCWRLDVDIERAENGVRLKLTLAPAADRLLLEGIPENVRVEARRELERLMSESFADHPLVTGWKRGDINLDGSGGESHSLKLKAGEENGAWAWHYPAWVPPAPTGPPSQWIYNLIEGRTVFAAPVGEESGGRLLVDPPLTPRERMPIPLSVMLQFRQWLDQRLRREPGIYNVAYVGTGPDGVARLVAARQPLRNIQLHDRTVESGLERIGIDLTEEQEMLRAKTGEWSLAELDEFLDSLDARYREIGFELVRDPRRLFRSQGGTRYFLPHALPLIEVDRFAIEGDVDLEGVPHGPALKDVVLTAPSSRREVMEGLARLRRLYTEAGYVFLGDVPPEASGWHIPVELGDGPEGRVTIKVARAGTVQITGELPESSQRALLEAIRMPEGKPFNIKDFRRRLFIATSRLKIALPSAVHYTYGKDGRLHALVTVGKPPSHLDPGAGYSSVEKWMASVRLELSHQDWAPGTSVVGFELFGSFVRQELAATATTLPLTKGGVRLAPSVRLSHRQYQIDPTGMGTDLRGGHLIGAGGTLGILIPLGSHGIASPWELQLIPGGGYFQRDIAEEGRVLTDRQPYLSGEVGVSYRNTEVALPNDQLTARVATGAYGTLGARDVDNTNVIQGEYQVGLRELTGAETDSAAGLFQIEVSGKGGIRRPVHGELTVDRLFQHYDIPLDFARSIDDRLVGDTYGNLALILAMRGESPIWQFISPFVGVTQTVDSIPYQDGRDTDYRVGLGLGLRVPIIGLQLYFGHRVYASSPRWRGRSPWTFGIGMKASTKL